MNTSLSKFVIAYISFHDNVLTQEVVEAYNEYSALEGYLLSKGIEPYEEIKSVEGLKSLCFDMDSMISAIKI